MSPKLSAREREKLIKRALAGEPVSKIAAEARVSRVLFYRWLKRYKLQGSKGFYAKEGGRPRKFHAKKLHRKPKPLSPLARAKMIDEVLLGGAPSSEIAKKYGISRISLYKWLKRYKEAGEGEKEDALLSKVPKIERYWRQAPEKYEEAVFSLVAKHPEYGVRNLVKNLPKVAGVSIVGHHGVQNILRRKGLSTYGERLEWAQGQVTPITRSITEILAQVANLFAIPLETRVRLIRITGIFLLSSFATIVIFGLGSYISNTFVEVSGVNKIGIFFAALALIMGSLFFLYSLKYYITLAIVLSFSQEGGIKNYELGIKEGKNKGLLSWLLGLANGGENGKSHPIGLEPNLEHVVLKRHPFISVHIPLYNEKNVVERIIAASTNFDYGGPASTRGDSSTRGGYEVILCDDSSDETTEIIRKYQRSFGKLRTSLGDGYTLTVCEVRPGVILKHLHRTTRSGFKGGALRLALKLCDPRTEFISVFDADFVPYPDTLELFLKYFQVTAGTLDFSRVHANKATNENSANVSESISTIRMNSQNSRLQAPGALATGGQVNSHSISNIAAVQGYQWHVLNKSENWITRGVRSEYAGSYVIERSGTEIYSGLKQISGSVYMVRRDVLEEIGWETSITEDFQLTLKLYEAGYKVVYTPYIQAPAECVSTIKRLIRQRMRWAEGHSNNIRRMFWRLMLGHYEEVEQSPTVANDKSKLKPKPYTLKPTFIPSPLTWSEKLEFLYLSPYYLQAFFFLVGTLSWLISETVFTARLPFWTSLWGWSLVLTNMLSLPLMNAVGLFLEESEERDYLGILSFVSLSYILVPFQAYAALKGFLEKEEGPWFRTPKTGRITDIFARGRFYRFISGILPGRSGNRVQGIGYSSLNPNSLNSNPYLSLATANNRFSSFVVKPKKGQMWVGRLLVSILLVISTTIASLAPYIEVVRDIQTGPASGGFILQNGKQSYIPNLNNFSMVKEAKAASDIQVISNTHFVQKAKGLQLEGEKVDFRVSEVPKFEIKERKNFMTSVGSFATGLFAKDKSSFKDQVKVELSDSHGGKLDLLEVKEADNDAVEISTGDKPLLKPGKYTLEVTFGQNTIKQDFTWGVLAINANKSIYLPDETAKIGMAVLDDEGKMVCTASLKLKVQSAKLGIKDELSTEDGSIKVNPGCGRKEIILQPDYESEYKLGQPGEYQLTLTAQTQNGTRTISDKLEVRDWVPFEVERTTATRIYPPEAYPMIFTIKVNEDYRGFISEKVPQSFEIYPIEKEEIEKYLGKEVNLGLQEGPDIKDAYAERSIEWLVSWQKGETYHIGYKYDAPNDSPELYLLGPLRIGDFKESRSWQVAVDTPQADFNIQRRCETPAAGTGTVTLTAGTDYTAPGSNSDAFIRMVSARLTGMGDTVGGGAQEANTFTWYISDPDFAGGTVVFTRAATTNPQRFCWEIIEYVGASSGANEMVVRAVGAVTYTATGLTVDGSSVSGIANDSDVAVFITGQDSLEATTETQVGAGLSSAEWVAASDLPRFTRGTHQSDANHISYAVVEFTGSNWAVERIQHNFSAAGSTETETITDVGALSRAFFHAQFRGATVAGYDEFGAEMWLSSTTQASFLLQSGATTPSDKYAVIWIVRNSDTGSGTAMNVQHISGSRASADTSEGANNEEDEWTATVTAVDATAGTSIMGETNRSAGTGGSSGPRGWITLYLNSTTGVKLYESDDGQTQNYRFQVVEWPLTDTGFNVTGTVFLANESTQATSGSGGQCNGSTTNLSLRVNGGTAVVAYCSSSDASFTFSAVSASAGDTITIYSTDSTDKSNRVYVSDGTADSGMNLYKNAVIVADEQDGTVTNADLSDWDNSNDSTNMLFDADAGALNTDEGSEFHIWSGDIFAPGGNVTISGSYHNAGTATWSTNTTTFDSTSSGNTIWGTLNGSSAFYKVTFNGSAGAWAIQDATKVSKANGTDTLEVLQGTVTLGDGTGDNLEVNGKTVVGSTSGNATFQTLSTLAQGSTITIDINNNATPVTCSNCIIQVGATSGSFAGTFTLNKNATLRFNSFSATQSGLEVETQGVLNITGSDVLGATKTTTSGTDEGSSTTYLYVGNQGWSDDAYNNMRVRMMSGLAQTKTYAITDTFNNSSNNYITLSGTATGSDSGTTVATNSDGTKTITLTSETILTAANEHIGRYVHNLTDDEWYLIIDSTETGSDTIKVTGYPTALTNLGSGDNIEVLDGIKVGDTFSIFDDAIVTAHATNQGYIYAKAGSQTTVRYADISELGRSADNYFGLEAVAVIGSNANESFTVEYSKVTGNYRGIRCTTSSFCSINYNNVASSSHVGIESAGSSSGSFIGNEVKSNADVGISVWSGSGSKSVVRNNYVYQNGASGIDVRNAANIVMSNWSYNNTGCCASILSNAGGNIIFNNWLFGDANRGYSSDDDPRGNILMQNEIFANPTGIWLSNASVIHRFYRTYTGTRGANTTDINYNASFASLAQFYDSDFASTTEVGTGVTFSGSYVASFKHDRDTSTPIDTKIWGEYTIPDDVTETPNNEGVNKFNYADNLWEDTFSPHRYVGSGADDTNLNFAFSGGTMTGTNNAYVFRVVCKVANCVTSPSNAWDVYRDEVDVGDASTTSTYTDGETGAQFKIDDAGADFGIGDTFIFGVWKKSSDTNTQKDITVMQTADSLTVGTGETLQLLGSSPANQTLVQKAAAATSYGISITGTINANYYKITGTDASGLNLGTGATVTDLGNGTFDDSGGVGASDAYITVVATILNSTGAKTWPGMIFDDGTTDANVNFNVTLSGTPSACGNSWTFSSSGNKGGATNGEANDSDIGDGGACNGANGYLLWQNSGSTSTSSDATAWSFQRKTFKDTTNSRYWRAFYDGTEIDIEYSANGSTWTGITSLAFNTNDFSFWYVSGNTYVYICSINGDDVEVRQGTLSASNISWGSAGIGLNGSGVSDTYDYCNIARDSSGYLWVIGRHYDGTNYEIELADSTAADPATPSFNASSSLSATSNTDANTYGVITPLNIQDMYTTWVRATNIEGCFWDDSQGRWENTGASGGLACSGGTNIDAIDTGVSGLSNNVSAVSDPINYDVHLVYIEDDTTDTVSYRRWDNGTGTNGTWQTENTLDTSDTDEYATVSYNESTRDLYAIYIDTSVNYINYRQCDVTTDTTDCSTIGNWQAEQNWKTSGTNRNATSNYSGSGEIFVLWTQGTGSPYSIMWDLIVVPETLWLFFGFAPFLPLIIKRKKKKNLLLLGNKVSPLREAESAVNYNEKDP